MIPNVANVLTSWQQSVLLKTVTRTRVDFSDDDQVDVVPLKAVVQPADKESLKIDSINWSKKYILVHSKTEIKEGQFIEWKGVDFKLSKDGDDYSDYGYYKLVGEETLKPLLVQT